MNINTHPAINQSLCGEPTDLGDGTATVELETTADMAADHRGLVHGGFVFGAADYAAMLAVNDPNVVLGAADCRFTAPVEVGSVVEIHAEEVEHKGKKRVVEVRATVDGKEVLTGTLTTFVLDSHVLDS